MSSAADIEIWDNAIHKFDNELHEEAVHLFLSMGTISSKISFNIGSVYFAKNNIGDALKVSIENWKVFISWTVKVKLFCNGNHSQSYDKDIHS